MLTYWGLIFMKVFICFVRIKQSIERAELEKEKDFTPFKGESTWGRPTIDYLLVRDAALTVIMMSGGFILVNDCILIKKCYLCVNY